MTTARIRTSGLAVLAMTLPLLAHAGPVATRKGFWWGFGLGYGSARVRCDQCGSPDREGSVAGSLRLGGTIGEKWLIGWEAGGWLKNSNGLLSTTRDVGRTLGNSSIVALYYPRAASGLFIKAGAGLSYAGFPPQDQPVQTCSSFGCVPAFEQGAHATGFGVITGVGYDIRVGSNLSLTPELALAVGRPGTLKEAASTLATGWRQDVLALNLSLTFH